LINWFKRNIGEENASEEKAERLCYSTDASKIKGKTILVIRPETTKQIHHSILFLKRNRKTVTIRGGGTGLRGGCVPEDSVVLDTSRMNKISEVGRDYARVEPGVTLSKLNNRLKKAGKYFPVSPYSQETCTLGGMIATNALGRDSLKYGRTGNWVMEVEIIDGEGRYRKAELGDVVGKEGTTGIIISAKLKIIDLPKKKKITIYKFDYITELVFKLKEIKEANSVEFVNKKAATLSGMEPKNYLVIETEAGNEEEEGNLIEEIYSSLASQGYTLVEDPKIPTQGIEKFLIWLEKNDIPAFGPIMSGIIHPVFKSRAMLGKLYDVVEEVDGEIVGNYGIGMIKKEYASSEIRKRIKELKKKYDPDNVINRGKII